MLHPSTVSAAPHIHGVIVLINTQVKKRGRVFFARYSGGPKRPTSPTHGAAGGNLRDMQEMVHDLDIMHHLPHTPKTSACGAGKARSHAQI